MHSCPQHPDRLEIVPALLDVFVNIEATGQAVEFEQKFSYRRPMYDVMKYLWPAGPMSNSFVDVHGFMKYLWCAGAMSSCSGGPRRYPHTGTRHLLWFVS